MSGLIMESDVSVNTTILLSPCEYDHDSPKHKGIPLLQTLYKTHMLPSICTVLYLFTSLEVFFEFLHILFCVSTVCQ